MADQNSPGQSAVLREEGNALYKQGEIIGAIDLYKKAAEHHPTDPTPLSNLSAALFEIGHYNACGETIQKALSLVHDEVDPLKVKLTSRLVKSHLYRKRLIAAKETLAKLPSTCSEYALLKAAYDQARTTAVPSQREKILNQKTFTDSPRYRPTLKTVREYFNFGHDEAVSQFDRSLASASPDSCAILFGGVGDARHLYATMMKIADYELAAEPEAKRQYHFTINDVKTPTLARNVILFSFLQDLTLSEEPSQDLQTLTIIFYLFCSQVMPAFVFDSLQEKISTVLAAIDAGEPILDWISFGNDDRFAIGKVLRSWQDAENCCSTSQISASVVQENKQIRQEQVEMFGEQHMKPPKGCEMETAVYHKTCLLYPPEYLLERMEPALQILLNQYHESNKMPASKIKKYINEHWKVNVTFIDVEWEKERREDDDPTNISFNPFEAAIQLYGQTKLPKPGDPTRLYDHVAPFFVRTAAAIKHLKGRMLVEGSCGELFTVLEKLRYGILDSRDSNATCLSNSKDIPKRYDRMHLSNIPDYCGGHMSSFLYAIPLLTDNEASYITSTNLRNPGIFGTAHDFNNEYLLINNDDHLFKLLQVSKMRDISDSLMGTFGGRSLPGLMPMIGYIDWRHVRRKPLPFNHLVQKEPLGKWLYAVFFKIALPTDRRLMNFRDLIFSPLNLTIYFRLVLRLWELGYPSHWLSAIIANIIANTVITSARPAKSAPLTIEEVKRQNPVKKVTTAPYAAEMSTLTTQFQPMLPFTIVTTALPKARDIYEYIISFSASHVLYKDGHFPVCALLFYNNQALGEVVGEQAEAMINWRPLFDNEFETGAARYPGQAQQLHNLRESYLSLWSTFNWHRNVEEAHIQMRHDFADRMMRDRNWRVGILRTDIWRLASRTEAVKEAMVRGRQWSDTLN